MTINVNRGGACCNFALVIESTDNRVQSATALRDARTAWVKDRMAKVTGRRSSHVYRGTDERSKSRGQTCLFYALREGGR